MKLRMKYKKLLTQHKISDVTSNSKEIKIGSAFVAIKGGEFDGNDFIEDVIRAGVNLIFTERDDLIEKYKDIIPVIYTDNPRKTLSSIATELVGKVPSNLIAVTGTNGKTSTVHHIAQLLSCMGHKAATIGTLGVNLYHDVNNIELSENTGLTTAGSTEFNKQLAILKEKGVDYCIIEASSIGLEQYRLYGRKFKVAGFTSFSRDHIDYHKTMDDYLKAKLLLFSDYLEDEAMAVINSDMQEYDKIAHYLDGIKKNYVSAGSHGDFQVKLLPGNVDEQEFNLLYKDASYRLKTNILGNFQVSNIALAVAMLCSIGYGIGQILPYIPDLTSPPGRLERVSNKGWGASVFIDYAHTPDALENVLKELKEISLLQKGKVLVVFGCGGDRDKGKRKLMGEVASKYADIIIITDDNPRSEPPEVIRREILEGAIRAIEIAGRREAIKYAIDNMKKEDVILIAGKGHEDYQIIGNMTCKFSDKETAKEICDKKPL